LTAPQALTGDTLKIHFRYWLSSTGELTYIALYSLE
jgi:hypothetical protein